MDIFFTIKTIHIISAAIIFGTGIGIAFFMFRSRFTTDLSEKFFAIRTTVLADYFFTAPAVILQPATGIWLLDNGGYDPAEPWLMATYILYGIAGFCWLPVVAIQIKLKKIISGCLRDNSPLPPQYHSLFRLWLFLGWPAFLSLIVIFFLMVIKPA